MERRTRGREMTNKEVKNNFVQNLAENAYINMCSAEEMKIAIEALEKQIPKKPTAHKVDVPKIKVGNGFFGKGTTVYRCPCCNELISRICDCCYKCGQAIDWGVKE